MCLGPELAKAEDFTRRGQLSKLGRAWRLPLVLKLGVTSGSGWGPPSQAEASHVGQAPVAFLLSGAEWSPLQLTGLSPGPCRPRAGLRGCTEEAGVRTQPTASSRRSPLTALPGGLTCVSESAHLLLLLCFSAYSAPFASAPTHQARFYLPQFSLPGSSPLPHPNLGLPFPPRRDSPPATDGLGSWTRRLPTARRAPASLAVGPLTGTCHRLGNG